ncbi:MAG: beta-aspartyl-peptidase [Paraclostridium sp.]|uniref:beta-aspartyl-peptidase n=1 Tax=Paraclostridium sp. TaxID=2023273 RepID=UPI003F4056F0
MILIKNVYIYSPDNIGKKDVFVCGDKITLIEDDINLNNNKVTVIDGSNKILVPGFIDQHVHITGGGGEGSFKTRVPEIMLSKLTSSGITTVVGLLGTDASTRSVENLVSKAKALKEEGLSVYTHTGSYEYPTVTLTQSVRKDIVFIDEIIGCKIALSDHRSSTLTNEELQRVASDVRVAGMISGKAGILICHMGDGKRGLNPINESLENSDIPIRTFRPTHVNRSKSLLEQSFEFAKKGGVIDLTCGIYDELSPKKVIKEAIQKEVPIENITISSDGYGSWSNYDEQGNLVKIGVSSVDALYKEFKAMVIEEKMNIEDALKYATTNVAKALDLYPKKGVLKENSDADMVLLDKNLEIDSVIARGKIMVKDKKIKIFGTYE